MVNPPPADRIAPISADARAASLRETYERAPEPRAIRVFGYGSLMWNPCFDFVDRTPAVLRGHRRGFCMWSVHSRGTPEKPGLGVALEPHPEGVCHGVVYTLPPEAGEADLLPLWERELWTDGYSPAWVEVETESGALAALTFVIRQGHALHAGEMPLADKARYIAAAAGKFGPCRDYLAETAAALRSHGVTDPGIDELLAAVERISR